MLLKVKRGENRKLATGFSIVTVTGYLNRSFDDMVQVETRVHSYRNPGTLETLNINYEFEVSYMQRGTENGAGGAVGHSRVKRRLSCLQDRKNNCVPVWPTSRSS